MGETLLNRGGEIGNRDSRQCCGGYGEEGKKMSDGKVIAERPVSKEVLRSTFLKVWRPNGLVFFIELSENMFLVEFSNEGDQNKIGEGRPWLFDKHLFVMKDFDGLTPPRNMKFETASFWVQIHNLPLACMNREVGYKIGSSVGACGGRSGCLR